MSSPRAPAPRTQYVLDDQKRADFRDDVVVKCGRECIVRLGRNCFLEAGPDCEIESKGNCVVLAHRSCTVSVGPDSLLIWWWQEEREVAAVGKPEEAQLYTRAARCPADFAAHVEVRFTDFNIERDPKQMMGLSA